MIIFKKGNLLEADSEALVNTVNTVGVMGKGIALMFKERFRENFKEYEVACKEMKFQVGTLFITRPNSLLGPQWIVNFATKQHWRGNSKIEWIRSGLVELRAFVVDNNIKSIAIPPLGAGNGGLIWSSVRPEIESALSDIPDVEIVVYEPTPQYQNVSKRTGVDKLTPARAIIAELVRRYWILGMECSLLEIQKLAWFAENIAEKTCAQNPLQLDFNADKFGPYATKLNHLLNALDGSYLHCEKRISDAGPLDVIWFEEAKRDFLGTYIKSTEFGPYLPVLEEISALIDGFESPFGMELLATVGWLLKIESCEPTTEAIKKGLKKWPKGATRKVRIFNDRVIGIALDRFRNQPVSYA